MNNTVKERIKNLAIQARREVKRPGVFTEAEFEEKFAELIVQECINVSLKSSHRYDDMGAIIARNIEDHFGVEL